MDDLCGRLLAQAGLPAAGGTPAAVILTIDAGDLAERRGHGVTSDGTVLPAAEVRRIADQAEVFPILLDAHRVALDMGRSRRIATPTQTLALVARDQGCSFPGCDWPPDWCPRHHIRDWADGAPTDLDNLTLLRGYHHRHFADHGWTCQLTPDRLPAWTPPKWNDPKQQTRLNARIHPAHRRPR